MSTIYWLVGATLRFVALAGVFMLLSPGTGQAQALGTLRWQLAPHCNVVTLAVAFSAGVFRLEGTDDQCQAAAGPAPVIGTATLVGGTAVLGFSVTTAPSAMPVHVLARIDTATLGGSWSDSAGNGGTFVASNGSAAGTPRPPVAGVTAPTLTIAQNGAIGGTLTVGSSSAIGGTLGVAGDGVIGGALNVFGGSSVGGSLNVIGNSAVGGSLHVAGGSSVAGTSTTARLGVGMAPAAAALAVRGNTVIDGKMTRPASGADANLLPLAYGYVQVGGTVGGGGTAGLTASYQGGGNYIVDFGRDARDAVVFVTPQATTPVVVSVYTVSDTSVGVRLFNLQGQATTASFQIIAFKK